MIAVFFGGLLAGFLAASLACNLLQYRAHRAAIQAALQHEQRLLDRARGAELRSEQQIDTMLARVSTTPRLEIKEADTPRPAIDPNERLYISDLPTDDEAWNDHLGADPDEDLS